jgi:putative N6-adenine-specific DNA methylase
VSDSTIRLKPRPPKPVESTDKKRGKSPAAKRWAEKTAKRVAGSTAATTDATKAAPSQSDSGRAAKPAFRKDSREQPTPGRSGSRPAPRANPKANTQTSSRLAGFAVCPSGLEDALTEELKTLPGFQEVIKGRGGARFVANPEAIARANIWARIPTRILIEVGSGTIREPDDIRLISTKILWENWFTVTQTLRIDLAVGREPKLDKPLARNFATLLVKDGICDRFRIARGKRPSIDTAHPDIRVWAFLDQNTLTIYLDSSGEPLFKRGWRQAKGDAPLRENLAAALVAMTEWDGQAPLMDPFCGSGTLLIEAMQRALKLPPGYTPGAPRSFAAEGFHPTSPMGQVNWRALRAQAKEAIDRVTTGVSIPAMQGSDIDSRMVALAQQNAVRALPEVAAQAIEWKTGAFRDVVPIADHGVLVTNPPYGKRLEQDGRFRGRNADGEVDGDAEASDDTHEFERAIAETLKKHYSGWQAWILSDNLKLETAMRLKAARRVPVFNGDIECRWVRFDMVAGSMREQ